ncbi:MAG: PBP1A family penicillin-binding protein [Hyphomicrobiaceae bacterium]
MGLFSRRTGNTPDVEPELPFPAPPTVAEPAAPESGAASASAAKPQRRRLMRRLDWRVRFAVYATATSAAGAAMWLAAMLVHYTMVFPDPHSVSNRERGTVIRILARDGSTLAERGAAQATVPLDMLPPHVWGAVVATEDRRFFSHFGVDVSGLARAAFANLRAGRFVQGGSTITQQLAKNLFLSSERTLSRKLDELALAVWLEVRLTKREILELYLNRVYFGGGAYGIEAAAQRYFDKSARALNVAEAALLAGLLKAPSKYAPTASKEAAVQRQRAVLEKMRDAGAVTAAEYRTARASPLRFADLGGTPSVATGFEYAVDLVLENLPSVLSDDRDELIVETTLDPHLQRIANQRVERMLAERGKAMKASQAALITIDIDGGIRALVGGRSYAQSQFNRATRARRQPGSAFKPFVYLAAVEGGMSPDTITYDLPLTIDNWSPRNDSGTHVGALTLRQALAQSVNTVAVRLSLDVGLARVGQTAHALGITSPLREDPSLALGTSELSLMELVGAYGAFASGGIAVQPHIVRRVRLANGRIIYARPGDDMRRVIDLPNVGAMNDMLNAALVAGTGRRAALPRHPAAGKTGTTQDYRDAWFIGFTGHFTTGVWVGNDDGSAMARVMGGNVPAELWRSVMLEAHRGRNAVALPGTSSASAVARNEDADAPLAISSTQEVLPWLAPKTPAPNRAPMISAASPRRDSRPSLALDDAPPPQRPVGLRRLAADVGRLSPPPIGQRIVIEPPSVARSASAQSHPNRSIDPDFLSRVLQEPPTAARQPSQLASRVPNPSPGTAQGGGFDADEIRRMIEGSPEAVRRPPGVMALGAATAAR